MGNTQHVVVVSSRFILVVVETDEGVVMVRITQMCVTSSVGMSDSEVGGRRDEERSEPHEVHHEVHHEVTYEVHYEVIHGLSHEVANVANSEVRHEA